MCFFLMIVTYFSTIFINIHEYAKKIIGIFALEMKDLHLHFKLVQILMI